MFRFKVRRKHQVCTRKEVAGGKPVYEYQYFPKATFWQMSDDRGKVWVDMAIMPSDYTRLCE